METVFSLKSSIWFWLGNENRRIHLGPFLDRDSDDDNDDNDDDSDDSDENFEEWMNNSGNADSMEHFKANEEETNFEIVWFSCAQVPMMRKSTFST